MELPSEIDSPIGLLHREPDSLEGSVFWYGSLQGIEFNVSAPGLPSDEQLAFIQTMLDDYENLVQCARSFLARSIRTSPEAFGVSQTIAEEIGCISDDDLLFDLPDPTFYEGDEWIMRFAEGRYLPAFDDYGVIVEFAGTEPVTAADLSDATPIA
jgi:hypothetical protein